MAEFAGVEAPSIPREGIMSTSVAISSLLVTGQTQLDLRVIKGGRCEECGPLLSAVLVDSIPTAHRRRNIVADRTDQRLGTSSRDAAVEILRRCWID